MARTGNLYERLGGEEAIRKIVDQFVARAAADPAVNFTRRGHATTWEAAPHNVDQLKQRLVEYIATLGGGPAVHRYRGNDMVSVHKGMAISNAEFDAAVKHLRAALEANDVPPREREELLGALAPVRAAIVEAPDRPTVAEPPVASLPVEPDAAETAPVTEDAAPVEPPADEPEPAEGPQPVDEGGATEPPTAEPAEGPTEPATETPTDASADAPGDIEVPAPREPRAEEPPAEYDPC